MSSKKERRRAKKRNDRVRDEAWESLERGRLDLALRLIQRAIDQAPGNARYWHDQGVILERRGRIGPAIDSFAQAVELSPRYADALRRLAHLVEGRGETERAIDVLERLVEVEPGKDEARERLARLRADVAPRRDVVGVAEPGSTGAGDEDEPPPVSRRTERYDWSALERELTKRGCCLLRGLLKALPGQQRFRDQTLPTPCWHASARPPSSSGYPGRRLRPYPRPRRRLALPVLRAPAAAPGAGAARGGLRAPRADREPLERPARAGGALPRAARGLPCPLPRGGADPHDAAPLPL